MKIKIAAAASVMSVAAFTAVSAYAADTLQINATDRTMCYNGGEVQDINTAIFSLDDVIYISVDDALKICGYGLGWDAEQNAVCITAPNDDKTVRIKTDDNIIYGDNTTVECTNAARTYHSQLYIPMDMFFELTDYSIWYSIDGPIRVLHEKDFLENTEMTDKYRYSGTVTEYGSTSKYGVLQLMDNGFGFEKCEISREAQLDYCDAVNMMAETLPDEVNVYNMLIPNSGEIYAPKEYTTSLLDRHREMYGMLIDRVTPINVYDNMLDHGNEHIYFNTDHHWTQRGAYYAYQAFAEAAGKAPVMLKDFESTVTDGMVGSYRLMAEGTDGEKVVQSNPETLERFYPNDEIIERVFNDGYMNRFSYEGKVINDDLLSYDTFLGCDVPLMELHNTSINDGSKLCIVKESYANAFATWAVNNYEYVYLIDIRCFNGIEGHEETLDIKSFYDLTKFDDLLIMNYPDSVADEWLRYCLRTLIGDYDRYVMEKQLGIQMPDTNTGILVYDLD